MKTSAPGSLHQSTGNRYQRDPVEGQVIFGSTLPAFLVAFTFIFVAGGLLAIVSLTLIGSSFVTGWYLYPMLLGSAGYSGLLARIASFQLATRVELSPQGVRAEWRGPFGGRNKREWGWGDIETVEAQPTPPVISVKIRGSIYVYVTARQARAILLDSRCVAPRITPRTLRRVGLSVIGNKLTPL